MSTITDQDLLGRADEGIRRYLAAQRDEGRITGSYYDEAVKRTLPNLRKWLLAEELDRISPNTRDTLRTAIASAQWEDLTNAFSRDVSFGTGGIREKMGARRDAVLKLKERGIHAPIIKGPNTINDVTLLLTSAGVAKFGQERRPPLTSIVIGFDSRVRGADFARLIARLFLAYDYIVYLFDEACLYPSVTLAVPALKADVGVFISASHNDFRYNGFKLSCQNGSQFDPSERNVLYKDYITQVGFADIRSIELADARPDQLWFLGGTKPSSRRVLQNGKHLGVPLADPLPEARELYAGREDRILDLHTLHGDQVKQFLIDPERIGAAKRPLSIGYCAFNGSGRKLVPRMLGEIGFKDVKRIMKLDPLDGMFPAFCSDPGKEQQPDPGDWRAADIAVSEFKQEHGARAWDALDIILGTDPDADRCGTIVKVPPAQREAYPHPGTGELRDYVLISADDAWALILWYRFQRETERFGRVVDAEKKFIVLSHTTTEALRRLARKYDVGVLTTWVGFAQLAAGTRAVWDLHVGKDTKGLTDGGRLPMVQDGRRRADEAVCNRTIHSWEGMDDRRRCVNIAALEQSNGFSLLGDVPPDDRSLGRGGHVRDKDGTLAAMLVAELAQYAKQNDTSILELLDRKIFLDPDIGLYITHYEPDPIDGEYEGLAGYTKKRRILDAAEELFASCSRKPFSLGGLVTSSSTSYRTGKYDSINWPGFPDEGYRFFFDADRRSHLTIRPSGTSNALRFHVQLFGGHPTHKEVVRRKSELRATATRIVSDIRARIGAGR